MRPLAQIASAIQDALDRIEVKGKLQVSLPDGTWTRTWIGKPGADEEFDIVVTINPLPKE